MNAHIPQALLSYDVFQSSRPGMTADTEGDPSGSRTAVLTGRGTWRELSPTEQLLAAQRGQTLHAELAVVSGTAIQAGDFVTVRGNTYQVAAIDELRTFRRCSLRTKEE